MSEESKMKILRCVLCSRSFRPIIVANIASTSSISIFLNRQISHDHLMDFGRNDNVHATETFTQDFATRQLINVIKS